MTPWFPHHRAPRAGLAAILLACALALTGCGEPSAAELLASARSHLAKNEVEAARLELKTLLQTQPNSAEARFLLGKLMFDTGDIAAAEAELRRALEGGHPESTVLPLLARSMLGLGKGALLLQQFGKVKLSEAQADAELKTQLATALAGENDLAGARDTVNQALQQSPDFSEALLLRARLTAADGDPAGALKEVEALLARQADNADAWVLKADLLVRDASGKRAADTTAAADAYRQALKLKAYNVQAHVALIKLDLARGDAAAANVQWTALQKAAPRHPQTMFFEAVLAEQKADYKRTRELTQQLLRGAPNDPQVLMLAGQAELKLNSLTQAEVHFAKAMQVAPKAPLPRRQLAQVQLRGGQADKALVTLRPLLEADPPDADALSMAAQAQMTLGNTVAADASLAKASKLKPDDPRLRTAVALSKLAKGKDPAAIAELRAIAAADKGSTADLALINVLVRQNDPAGALKAVDTLAAKLPGDALPDQLRGRLALQRKDAAAARQAFEAALVKNADYLPALAGLAALDIADKQPAAAKARFEALLMRNPKHAGALMALAEKALPKAPKSPAVTIGRAHV